MKTVLISVVGSSPAVLTETVWVLAQENPPVIPDRVVAITTTHGKQMIQSKLFQRAPVWNELQQQVGMADQLRFGADDSIRVIGDGSRDFDDIASLEENEQAADFILDVIRQYSENPEVKIIASIAGGRKTMSALMLACMSLLGREQDRVCHVLADETYICENRDFCYPKDELQRQAAQVQLSDMPFIRVRGLYEQLTGSAPKSYSAMVNHFRSAVPKAIAEELVVFNETQQSLRCGNIELALSPAEFQAAYLYVFDRFNGNHSSVQDLLGAKGGSDEGDSFRRNLSRVRRKLKDEKFILTDRLLPSAREKNYLYKRIHFE